MLDMLIAHALKLRGLGGSLSHIFRLNFCVVYITIIQATFKYQQHKLRNFLRYFEKAFDIKGMGLGT